MPIAIKLVLNFILFLVYVIIFVTIGDFLYGAFVYYILNEAVASSQDIIHIKIAILVSIFTLIFTVVLRKYFYISLMSDDKIILEKLKYKNEQNLTYTQKKERQKYFNEFEFNEEKNDDIKLGDMEIFFDKEIKK